MECLKTGKICPTHNLKCKICKLNDCREVLNMIEYDEKRLKQNNLKLINIQLPEQCKNCSFLQVIDLKKKIVRCPFRIKRCLIK